MGTARHRTPRAFAPRSVPAAAAEEQLSAAVEALTDADVTLLVGHGALAAREQVLDLADTLGAPMVLTPRRRSGWSTTTRSRSAGRG